MSSTTPQPSQLRILIEDFDLPAVEAITPTARKTALNAVHRQMGAKMVEFNGWDMPVEYPSVGGIMAEHNAVRTGVGVFDVSHMGDIRLSGPKALAAVQHISMNDAARLAVAAELQIGVNHIVHGMQFFASITLLVCRHARGLV